MNTYKTHNVCSRTIDFEIENNIVTDCKFNGGCPGNTQGVAALVKGMTVDGARLPSEGHSVPQRHELSGSARSGS